MFKGIKKYLHENQEMITMGLLVLSEVFSLRLSAVIAGGRLFLSKKRVVRAGIEM